MSCDSISKKKTNTKTLTKNKHEKYVQYCTDTNGSYIHQTALYYYKIILKSNRFGDMTCRQTEGKI
jgi:hypothetical protein